MSTDKRKPFHFANGRQFVQQLAARLLDEFALFAGRNTVYLFEQDAKIQSTPVNVNKLRALVDERLCAICLILRDGRYEPEHYQIGLSRQDLTDTLADILKLAPPAPMFVKTLSPMETDHAIQRLRQGEPPASIGPAYGVPEAVILDLRKAA
jgi:hypothetical protein